MSTKEFYTYEEIKKEFGLKDPTMASILKNYRQCEELTQAQMAKTLKISKSHLSDIENGRKFVSIERAMQFAKRLKYPESYFIHVVLREQLAKANCNYDIEIKERSA